MRDADAEGRTGCDSTDGKRAEQADPQTQRMGSWLSALSGEEMGVTANGNNVSFWNVLELVMMVAQHFQFTKCH